MPFRIDWGALNQRDYSTMHLAVSDNNVVSLLSPLYTRDEIYEISSVLMSPHSFNEYLYDTSATIIYDEETNTKEILDLFKREIKQYGYDFKSTHRSLRLSHTEDNDLYIISIQGNEFKLSSTAFLDPDEMKTHIPRFLEILELLINCGYEAGGGEQDLAILPVPMREPDLKPQSLASERRTSSGEESKRFEVIEREFLDVDFSDIGGCEEAKKQLSLIDLGIRHPEIYEVYGAELPHGILLYGPPGTGKTMLAKASAKELDANFYSINGADILSKWYGESEKNLRELFEKAKSSTPSVIFIDEIDALMPQRDTSHEVTVRIVSLLLQEMDGIRSSKGMIIMGATNRLNHIDPAFLRPGRFDLKLEIPLPDDKALEDIYRIHLKGRNTVEDIDYKRLAKVSKDLSGADVKGVVNACVFSKIVKIRNKMPEIITRDSVNEITIEQITTEDMLRSIEQYKKELKSLVFPPGENGMYA
ncbi:transitional endoplasmic reticulum ATPase [Methanohalophilus levihalophilus]|uniref:ATP-binding protein n=1 Tax=Methanohalophilus levihalophilus TaxID=1431282 RepID=UPI001AE9BE3B|nr:ATP-binding protein [Methanohalophilus levihalophilus]MBP2029135.1 transitional endoplasmic reticulum ATPase [Methanohalophilus levihalophilus]